MSFPAISVMIPTRNRCVSLGRVLDSLEAQTFKDFEVIVVDGGSTDKTRELVSSYAQKLSVVFTIQEGSLVSAENKGLKTAKGEIFIRTDDDIVATPEWLQEIFNTFQLGDNIGGATGPTIIPEERKELRDLFYFQKKLKDGNFLWRMVGNIYFNYFLEGEAFTVSKWFRSGAFSLGSNYEQCRKLPGPLEVTNQEACNLAVRRQLLERINGFDYTFGGIGDYNEADVAFKIRKSGYKIMFNPKAAVWHIPSTDGFFKERASAYPRMMNFINFYFRHIKPDNLDKALRFFSYLIFLNGYYIYKGITSRQFNQFGSIPATLLGLAKNILKI
ncbi:MAG: glycosyltransferase [Candidatus Omnitrophica bacterium]|nr:glycosyltransferase [Candidatus Omnitrophota bacterium]